MGKNFTYIHDFTYSNKEDINTPSNSPYLSGGFVSPETMAHNPRCTVLHFEKQWFGGWPGCMLGPECRNPRLECRNLRLETTGKREEFSDEGEKLWHGGQLKINPYSQEFDISRGSSQGPVQHGAVSYTPLLFEVRACGAEKNSALQVEHHKELAGLHLIIWHWKHPPRHREHPMPFTVSWANMPIRQGLSDIWRQSLTERQMPRQASGKDSGARETMEAGNKDFK